MSSFHFMSIEGRPDLMTCADCRCDYDAAMPRSMNLSREQWLRIFPEETGVLCANCIIRRAARLPDVISVAGIILFASDYNESPPQISISHNRQKFTGTPVTREQALAELGDPSTWEADRGRHEEELCREYGSPDPRTPQE